MPLLSSVAVCPSRAVFRLPVKTKPAVAVNVVEPLIGLGGGLLMIGVPGVTPVAWRNGTAVTKVAVIVVLPAAMLVPRRAAFIVATPGAEEVQRTEDVRFCVVPFLK